MIQISRWILRQILLKSFDIAVQFAELPRIIFLRMIKYSDLISTLELNGNTRIALVAPHPTQLLDFSMRHLIRGLIDNKYTIIVLLYDF